MVNLITGFSETDEVSLNGSPTVLPTTVAAWSGVRHEDGLEQAEERHRDQVGDEEIRIEEGQGERQAEDHDEDVDHALLRIESADL